jgi:hypothetical protein
MKLKKQLMTMALAMVLSFSTIIVPKNVTYALSESNEDNKSKVLNIMEGINPKDTKEIKGVKFQQQYSSPESYLTEEGSDLDTSNPNNYDLLTDEDFLLFMDRYYQFHALGYYESKNIDKTYGQLSFYYGCSDITTKSDYLVLELYKDNNGVLTNQENVSWDLNNTDESICDLTIDKRLYNNQPYLYFKAGVTENLNEEYDDAQLFKIKNPFYITDISGHWAEAVIRDFINKGYVGGYSDSTFKPNNSITRAEFVTIVDNYFGLTQSSGKVFSDTSTHWAKTSIDIAVTNGVCNGKTATEFKPNDPITREEAAVMISNYKKLSDANHDKLNKFTDKSQVSIWAKDGVEGIIENGYMGGYSDNTFKPKNKITRAEAVVTLSRVK